MAKKRRRAQPMWNDVAFATISCAGEEARLTEDEWIALVWMRRMLDRKGAVDRISRPRGGTVASSELDEIVAFVRAIQSNLTLTIPRFTQVGGGPEDYKPFRARTFELLRGHRAKTYADLPFLRSLLATLEAMARRAVAQDASLVLSTTFKDPEMTAEKDDEET